MLETMPAGVVIFPRSGISENLADKARHLGIPVWRAAFRPICRSRVRLPAQFEPPHMACSVFADEKD
ncbi:MAG: hypothetical protein JO105_22690 [Hyphomicrobiales bacterium]|nr:hypothetical protein [Hyphomicrobiales bacterium]